MPENTFLSFNNIELKNNGPVISWDIKKGENWLLRGDANSGKSELLQLITGKSYRDENKVVNYFNGIPEYGFYKLNRHIAYLNFRGIIANHQHYYYQQRYHSTELDDVATLKDMLFPPGSADEHELEKLIRLFGLAHCLNREIIKLSSGEYRKASVIQAILKNPRLLILDEPYSGLDTGSIARMDDLLAYTASKGILIIISSNSNHIAPVITNVLALDGYNVCFNGKLSGYSFSETKINSVNFSFGNLPENPDHSFNTAFEIADATVKYGSRRILNNINWRVERGEKWALSGRNGAGKSMLLSLVFADHPQVYSNKVYVFDRKRGTGESIWEVKERMGYFSSEMFLYYDKSRTTSEVSFSYLNVNPYRKRVVTKANVQFYEELLEYFEVRNFQDKQLYAVPFEVQRIFMLMNVFLSNAPLIILDEPYHGLDDETIKKLNKLISEFCVTRTLIFVSHNKNEIPSVVAKDFHLFNGEGQVRKFNPQY